MLRRKIYQNLVSWKLQKDKMQLKEALLNSKEMCYDY